MKYLSPAELAEYQTWCLTQYENYKWSKIALWTGITILVLSTVLFHWYMRKYGAPEEKKTGDEQK